MTSKFLKSIHWKSVTCYNVSCCILLGSPTNLVTFFSHNNFGFVDRFLRSFALLCCTKSAIFCVIILHTKENVFHFRWQNIDVFLRFALFFFFSCSELFHWNVYMEFFSRNQSLQYKLFTKSGKTDRWQNIDVFFGLHFFLEGTPSLKRSQGIFSRESAVQIFPTSSTRNFYVRTQIFQ